VDVDPRAWADGFDMSVSVGLGTGNKDQAAAHMMALLQLDQQIIMLQKGIQGPLVTGENLFNKLEKLVQAMGLHSVDPYYSDPESPKMQAAMQAAASQPPPPDPSVQIAQMGAATQMHGIQAQQQVDAQKAQNDQAKTQIDAMDKKAASDLAMRKQLADEAYKQRELDIREREAAIKEQELGIKNNDTQIRASLEQAKIADGQQARSEARMAEQAAARNASLDAAMAPANGQPHPLEMMHATMQQHGQMLGQLAGAIAQMSRPKAGRMVKRGDGVWDFAQADAPTDEPRI
jgi:hypothetical protein